MVSLIAVFLLGAFVFGIIATLRCLWNAGTALQRRPPSPPLSGAGAVQRWKESGHHGESERGLGESSQ